MTIKAFRIIGALGLALLIIALIVAAKQYGPQSGSDFWNNIQDGRTVTCTTFVDAEFTGQPLRVTGANCAASTACFVSPTHSFSIAGNIINGVIGNVKEGSIAMLQSGRVYDRQSVSVNAFNTASTPYTLKACVPKEATQVRIGIYNDQGGILNDQAYNIN